MDEATKLLEAVNRLGMAGCNVCPYLRSIDEIGGSWQAAMSLIAAHKLFYTKVYRHRTVYLSAEVYALLRFIRTRPGICSTCSNSANPARCRS